MNHKTPFFAMLILLVGIVFMTAWTSDLQAQDAKMVNALFPTRSVLQRHAFDPVPVLIRVNEQGTSTTLAFDVPIPAREWQRMPKEKIAGGGSILAGFIHPDGPDHGLIQVMEYQPPYELSPSDWLLWTLEQGNMRVITTAGEGLDGPGPFFEALAVSELPKGSLQDPIMMRAAVFRSGKSFVLVRCMASSKSYLDLAYYFGVAIHRFELLNAQPPVLIGQWERQCLDLYCYTGPSPGSSPIASRDETIVEQFFSFALDGIRTGRLTITVVRSPLAEKTPAETRINNLLYSMIEKSGMSFDKDLVAFKGEHQNLGGTAYHARSQGFGADKTPIDFFVLSWEGDGSAVLIYMLTDAREKSPVAWMVNKRTFEVISQSLSRKAQ